MQINVINKYGVTEPVEGASISITGGVVNDTAFLLDNPELTGADGHASYDRHYRMAVRYEITIPDGYNFDMSEMNLETVLAGSQQKHTAASSISSLLKAYNVSGTELDVIDEFSYDDTTRKLKFRVGIPEDGWAANDAPLAGGTSYINITLKEVQVETGTFELVKTWIDINGDPIVGISTPVEFRVYNSGGDLVETINLPDASGSYTKSITLEVGEYTVVEEEVPGFTTIYDGLVRDFEVLANETVAKYVFNREDQPSSEVKLTVKKLWKDVDGNLMDAPDMDVEVRMFENNNQHTFKGVVWFDKDKTEEEVMLEKDKEYIVRELVPFGYEARYYFEEAIDSNEIIDATGAPVSEAIVTANDDKTLVIVNKELKETDDNFFISADDYYEAWIDSSTGDSFYCSGDRVNYQTNYRNLHSYQYVPGFTDDTTVAIKVEDLGGYIAGLKAMYRKDDGTYEVTNKDTWWVYAPATGENEPPEIDGRAWYDKDYVRGEGWKKVTEISESADLYVLDYYSNYWNNIWPNNDHHDWVYSENYLQSRIMSGGFDRVAFFRKEGNTTPPPTPEQTVYFTKEWQDKDGGLVDAEDVNKAVTIIIKDSSGNEVRRVTIPAKSSTASISVPEGVGYTVVEESIAGYEAPIYLLNGDIFNTFSVAPTYVVNIKVINKKKGTSSGGGGGDIEPSSGDSGDDGGTEEITETSVPEAPPSTTAPTSTEVVEDDIPDEVLPKTGGIPMATYFAMGGLALGLGVVLKKKK